MSSGHAVDTVVDENHGEVFASVAGVDCFACSDGGQVAVALICEHNLVGPHAFDTCSARWGASVGCFGEVNIEIVVCHNCATDWGDAYGTLVNAEFFKHFGYDAVYGTVTATWTIMEWF